MSTIVKQKGKLHKGSLVIGIIAGLLFIASAVIVAISMVNNIQMIFELINGTSIFHPNTTPLFIVNTIFLIIINIINISSFIFITPCLFCGFKRISIIFPFLQFGILILNTLRALVWIVDFCNINGNNNTIFSLGFNALICMDDIIPTTLILLLVLSNFKKEPKGILKKIRKAWFIIPIILLLQAIISYAGTYLPYYDFSSVTDVIKFILSGIALPTLMNLIQIILPYTLLCLWLTLPKRKPVENVSDDAYQTYIQQYSVPIESNNQPQTDYADNNKSTFNYAPAVDNHATEPFIQSSPVVTAEPEIKVAPPESFTKPETVEMPKETNVYEKPADILGVADEIQKYKNLLDMGAITQEEYDSKKKQLLNL